MNKKYYYLLSFIIFAAGLIAFGNYVYSRYNSLNELLVNLDMPGEVDIKIDTPGMYDIYFEDEITNKSGFINEKNTEKPFTLTVRNKEGISMPIQRTDESKKYSYMGRRGVSVYEVNLPREGIYKFSGVFNDKVENNGITLILDMGFSEKRSKTVVTAQAILLFPIVASLILFLYAYSKSRL